MNIIESRVKRFADMCELYNSMLEVLEKNRKFQEVIDVPEQLFERMRKKVLLTDSDCINGALLNIYRSELVPKHPNLPELVPQVTTSAFKGALDTLYNRIAAGVIDSFMDKEAYGFTERFIEFTTHDEFRAFTGFTKRKINGMLREGEGSKLLDSFALGIEQVIDRAEEERAKKKLRMQEAPQQTPVIKTPPVTPPRAPTAASSLPTAEQPGMKTPPKKAAPAPTAIFSRPPIILSRKKRLCRVASPVIFKIPPPTTVPHTRYTKEQVLEESFKRNFNVLFM